MKSIQQISNSGTGHQRLHQYITENENDQQYYQRQQ